MIPGLFERHDCEVFDFEGEVLERLASEVRPGQYIVEVGCYRGRSTAFLASGSHRGSRVPIFAVDPWTDAKANPSDLRATFDRTIEEFGHGLVIAFQGYSEDIAAEIEAQGYAGSLGLVHIDGSHHPEDLRADIANWASMVPEGGVVVFHDFQHPPLREVILQEMVGPTWKNEPLFVRRLHRVGIFRRVA